MSVSALLAALQSAAPTLCAQGDQGRAVSPSAAGHGERVVTDFGGRGSEDAAETPDLGWFTLLDGVMGGRSSGRFGVEDGVLRFRGTLNTNGGGFASVRTRDRDLGLGGFAGLHLRVRGDGRRYSVRLEELGEPQGRRASYRGRFETVDAGVAGGDDGGAPGDGWQHVYLPFSDFVPTWRGRVLDRSAIDPAAIGMLGLLIADGVDGPFALDVDWIRAYRPFALDDLRGARRVLLVSGPDAAHLDLLRLLVDLAEHGSGCDARDLTVVVLLDDGPSRVGPRPLTADEAGALRKRFDLEDGSFTAVLVGKDGTEKHRARSFVPADEWFARIDAMPMRQREMRQRGAADGDTGR